MEPACAAAVGEEGEVSALPAALLLLLVETEKCACWCCRRWDWEGFAVKVKGVPDALTPAASLLLLTPGVPLLPGFLLRLFVGLLGACGFCFGVLVINEGRVISISRCAIRRWWGSWESWGCLGLRYEPWADRHVRRFRSSYSS